MNHQELQNCLWDYYDNELPAQQRQHMDSHLAQCPECRAILDQWKKLSFQLFPSPNITPVSTEIFVSRVMAHINSTKPQFNWRLIFSPGWVISAATVALMLSFIFTSPSFRELQDPIESLAQNDNNGNNLIAWQSTPDLFGSEELAFIEGGK